MKLSRRDFLKGMGALGATGFSALLSSHHGAKLLPEPERAEIERWGRKEGIIQPQWQGVDIAKWTSGYAGWGSEQKNLEHITITFCDSAYSRHYYDEFGRLLASVSASPPHDEIQYWKPRIEARCNDCVDLDFPLGKHEYADLPKDYVKLTSAGSFLGAYADFGDVESA